MDYNSKKEKAGLDFEISGQVVPGHGVASGKNPDSRYGERGTLGYQLPLFEQLGLPVASFYAGTINVSTHPLAPKPVSPFRRVKDLHWYPQRAPETFEFFRCLISGPGWFEEGLIYRPLPETKIEHFDDPKGVQIIAPLLTNLSYGDKLLIAYCSFELNFE
jgi:hypothetical protein